MVARITGATYSGNAYSGNPMDQFVCVPPSPHPELVQRTCAIQTRLEIMKAFYPVTLNRIAVRAPWYSISSCYFNNTSYVLRISIAQNCLSAHRWTSSLPSCLWSQRIFPSLPGPRLTIFLSRCKFSTLTTRQPMVGFYLLTFPRFPLRRKEYKCEVGATERGCSGSIGSDDTRGYGAGSGDVGKEGAASGK